MRTASLRFRPSTDIGRGPSGLESLHGVAAGLLGFWVIFGTAGVPCAQADATLTGLEVRPSYFTPNGDGVRDSVEVVFTPGGLDPTAAILVEVYETVGGTLTATLDSTTVPVDQEHVVVWAPTGLADGTYRVDVNVADSVDEMMDSRTVVSDTVVPVLVLGAVGPNPFDPGALPPEELAVPFDVTGDDATTFVQILSGAAQTDTLGTFVGSGSTTLTWDGGTLAEGTAPSATYEVLAVAADLAGNADSALVTITLDRDPPTFATSLTDTVQTDSFPVLIGDDVVDSDRVAAVTFSLDGGMNFTPVDSISAPGPAVSWQTAIDIASPAPGYFSVLVRASDAKLHTTDQDWVIAYDALAPVAVSSTVVGSSTVADGGTVQIRSDWNQPGLDVTADFTPIDFGYVTGSETVVEDSPGSYLIEYRVTPSNIRAAGTYRVPVLASTGILTAADSVTVTVLDEGPRAEELFAVTRNRFDPDSGESVSIVAGRGNEPVRVEIYNLAGQPMRTLEAEGFVDWDGRTENGEKVSSGVYFLRITGEDAEEFRKVAVMRGGGS